MAIFFKRDIDKYTKLGIWHIEEGEDFFSSQVPLQREITHPHKRLQHLAGRYLLKYLFPDFPLKLIQIADTRKPFLEDEAYHFSISHCGEYAAVIASSKSRVGIDIEIPTEKILRIQHKFLSEQEISNFKLQILNPQFLTLMWSCKEAVFKWYGWGGVDFKKHIKIEDLILKDTSNSEMTVLFKKNEDLYLDLHCHSFEKLCLSYVIT